MKQEIVNKRDATKMSLNLIQTKFIRFSFLFSAKNTKTDEVEEYTVVTQSEEMK